MPIDRRLTKEDIFLYLESRGWTPNISNRDYWRHPYFTPEAMRKRNYVRNGKRQPIRGEFIMQEFAEDWWYPNALAVQFEKDLETEGG